MQSGGLDMSALLKQAQKMQDDMQKTQDELEKMEVEGSAGGGMVTVKANGKKKILSIKINPDAVDADDVEDLEDLVMAAVNQAIDNADKLSSDELNKVMPKLPGGFKLPGF
ncbi:MAG: YbaB/EbfC family nucleoid-associated protein [Candidatus Cloacimonadota bacterium]|nr:MAG: YbaB/EbfC family nucleoid-associated protein [Candidatus Cloacimonadota bacterium]PIE78451.1 MAG: YbaB/EbfC family nucleoid-associated protein [Candidatus Delongbacteria bacterium]